MLTNIALDSWSSLSFVYYSSTFRFLIILKDVLIRVFFVIIHFIESTHEYPTNKSDIQIIILVS